MKEDKWFSIIFAISMFILAVLSLLFSGKSFDNIANAIAFPLFLFTLLEVFGHIERSAMQSLDIKLKITQIEEKWMHSYYEMAKDSEEDCDKKCVEEYNQLLTYIAQLIKAKKKIEKWTKLYNGLYIIFGVLLTISAILAQENANIRIVFELNVAAVTLFTFAIFVIEPWVNSTFSAKLEKKAMEKVEKEIVHKDELR